MSEIEAAAHHVLFAAAVEVSGGQEMVEGMS